MPSSIGRRASKFCYLSLGKSYCSNKCQGFGWNIVCKCFGWNIVCIFWKFILNAVLNEWKMNEMKHWLPLLCLWIEGVERKNSGY